MIHPLTLVPVSLARADKHECPDIEEGVLHIAKIGDQYLLGRFNRQWYGLNFMIEGAFQGRQFDAPGWNSSSWKKLWKVVLPKRLHPAERELLAILKKRYPRTWQDYHPAHSNRPERGRISYIDMDDNLVVYSYKFNNAEPRWFCVQHPALYNETEWPSFRVEQTPVEQLAELHEEEDE